MAGLLSFLPGAIRGISSVIKGITEKKPIGDILAKGAESFIQPSTCPTNAADLLPTDEEFEQLKKMPTRKEQVIVQGMAGPEVKIVDKIIKRQVPLAKKTLDEIDDELDIKIDNSSPREAELLEDKIDSIEDKKLTQKREIRMKKRLLLG